MVASPFPYAAPLNTDFTIDRAYQWVLASTKKTKKKKEKKEKSANCHLDILSVCVHLESPKDTGLTLDTETKIPEDSSLPTGTHDSIKALRFCKDTAMQTRGEQESRSPEGRREGCLPFSSVSKCP